MPTYDTKQKDSKSETKQDPCTAYEERAAILEHCAGMTREQAERRARHDPAVMRRGTDR